MNCVFSNVLQIMLNVEYQRSKHTASTNNDNKDGLDMDENVKLLFHFISNRINELDIPSTIAESTQPSLPQTAVDLTSIDHLLVLLIDAPPIGVHRNPYD